MPPRDAEDPHAGLADLEPELDVQEMLTGARDEGDSGAVRAAAASLRTGSDDPNSLLGDEDDADDEHADDGDEDEILDDGAADDEGKDKDAEEAEDEDAEEGDDDASPAKTFTVSVPVLGRSGDEEQTLVLEGLPQEFHDQLKAHLKRSAEYDGLAERLQEAEQYQTASDFVTRQPLAAMLMLDQNDRESGAGKNIGERFTKFWMQQNPEAAIKLIRDLRYDDPDRLDPDVLKERAEAANLKVADAVRKGLAQQSGHTRTAQWTNEVRDVLRGAAAELGLDAEAQEDFMNLAIGNIGRESRRQKTLGRDPLLNRTEVVKQVQRAMQRFVTPGSPNGEGGKKGKRGSAAGADKDEGKFERRHRTQQRARQLGPGKATIPSVGAVVSLKKLKGAHGVKDAAAVLRQS